MRTSAKKVVFEWQSSLYMHIKSIRAGYEKAPTIANKQILICPAANNRTLTISTRNNSSEKWTFIEHQNYPLIPTDIQNLGQKTQPCKSKHSDVVFTFTSKKEMYKTVNKNIMKPLQINFKKKNQVLNNLLVQGQPCSNLLTDFPCWLQPPT